MGVGDGISKRYRHLTYSVRWQFGIFHRNGPDSWFGLMRIRFEPNHFSSDFSSGGP